MKNDGIDASMKMLRDEWRTARDGKLSRKAALLADGKDPAAVRHDRIYRECNKRQRRAAAKIRHIERYLNRKRAIEKKG